MREYGESHEEVNCIDFDFDDVAAAAQKILSRQ